MKSKTRKLFTTKALVALLALTLMAAAAIPAAVKGASTELEKLDGGGYLEEAPPEGEAPSGSDETSPDETSPEGAAGEASQEQEEVQMPQDQAEQTPREPSEPQPESPAQQPEPSAPQPESPAAAPVTEPAEEPAEESKAAKGKRGGVSTMATYEIDLSTTNTDGTGYTVTPVADTAGKYTLTFTSAAKDHSYTIKQKDESIFRDIVVDSVGTDSAPLKITLKGIDVTCPNNGTPTFALKGSSNVSLTLVGENFLTHSYSTANNRNAALNVPGGTTLSIIDGGSGSMTAQGGHSSAGIGGNGYDSSGAVETTGTINIKGGTVTATGGFSGAGIGSGTQAAGSGAVINISGGTVTATGGDFAAGIGGGSNSAAGTIAISGSATEVIARGSRGGAGIGSGSYYGEGGSINISGGNIKAFGGGVNERSSSIVAAGAGIGGMQGTLAINISGGTVVAVGGSDEYYYPSQGKSYYANGAGIGRGSVRLASTGNLTANVTISGSADVTATGAAGGSNGAAGIGPGYGDFLTSIFPNGYPAESESGKATVNLSIASTAKVKAYAKSASGSPILSALCASYSGSYFYVNAKLDPAPAAATRLDVYAKGGATVSTPPLQLLSGYNCFAYTTGATATQNDSILAYNASDGVLLGPVVRTGTSYPDNVKIPSVKNSTVQSVTIATAAVVGSPSVSNITADAATFTSTGHRVIAPATFVEGGFKYSTINSGSESSPVLGGEITTVKWPATDSTSPKSQTVSSLAASTLYYMATYFNATYGSSPINLTSGVVSFTTLPKITSASAIRESRTSAKVTAAFAGGNRNITSVKIYYATGTVSTSSLFKELTSGYTNTGFTNYALILPSSTSAYNLLVEITNQDGGKATFNLTAPALAKRTVTEKYVVIGGASPKSDTTFDVYNGEAYSKTIPTITGYTVKGYKVGGNAPTSGSDYTAGTTASIPSVTANTTVWFVYEQKTALTLSKVVTGAYASKSKEFTFTIQFKDKSNTALSSGTKFTYKGGTVAAGAVAKADGTLTIGSEGKATLTLCHGQSVTIDSLVVDGTKITISETGDTTNYAVSFKDSYDGNTVQTVANTKEIAMTGTTRTVAFTNTWNMSNPPDSGIAADQGGLPLILLASLFALIAIRRKLTA